MKYQFDDGGRKAAGFKGQTGDCVTRAIAIISELRYEHVYFDLYAEASHERRKCGRSSPRTGVHIPTIRRYLARKGWLWTPTMFIGSGCTVHLRENELPMGRLIVSASKHLTAVIDGVLHDTHDCSRNGTRCVYGYWRKA